MINVLIVDDEPLAQDVLETHISKLPELNLIQKCSNALEANDALRNHDIDLIFLDIQMPQLTGIEFLRTLSNPPLVIFTTAYPNYAVEGFELNAVDYLLKPISLDRFVKGVNKAAEQLKMKKGNTVSTVESTAEATDYIFVKADKKLIKVNYADIVYIEGLKDYVKIYTTEKMVLTRLNLKGISEKLPKEEFIRVHRSFIVAFSKISSFQKNKVTINQKEIPVGNAYQGELFNRLG